MGGHFDIGFATPSTVDEPPAGDASLVKSRLQDLVDYLNANLDHNFYFNDYGYVSQDFNIAGGDDFLERCAREIVEENTTAPHEIFCIAVDVVPGSLPEVGYGLADSFNIEEEHGGPFGGSTVTTPYNACYVGAGLLAPSNPEIELFSWHEPMHCWTFDHGATDHGRAAVAARPDFETDRSYLVEITPMGSCYVYDSNGENDTDYPPSDPSQTPEQLNAYPSDPIYDSIENGTRYQGTGLEDHHRYDELSPQTLDAVESYLDYLVES